MKKSCVEKTRRCVCVVCHLSAHACPNDSCLLHGAALRLPFCVSPGPFSVHGWTERLWKLRVLQYRLHLCCWGGISVDWNFQTCRSVGSRECCWEHNSLELLGKELTLGRPQWSYFRVWALHWTDILLSCSRRLFLLLALFFLNQLWTPALRLEVPGRGTSLTVRDVSSMAPVFVQKLFNSFLVLSVL